jgi:hypothetical protein
LVAYEPFDKFGQPYHSAVWGDNKRRFTETDVAGIIAALPKPEAVPARHPRLDIRPLDIPKEKELASNGG